MLNAGLSFEIQPLSWEYTTPALQLPKRQPGVVAEDVASAVGLPGVTSQLCYFPAALILMSHLTSLISVSSSLQ